MHRTKSESSLKENEKIKETLLDIQEKGVIDQLGDGFIEINCKPPTGHPKKQRKLLFSKEQRKSLDKICRMNW